jgi:immunoglobulin-binding protein 1
MYPIEDVDAAEKDDKEDQDDPEELERQRNFDEYKDDHKRGEGNRHNRG